MIKRLNTARWNAFARQSPTGYVIAVLLAYCAVAGALDVNLVFAAFLAGFAVIHKKRRIFDDAIEAIGKVSFAFFIPLYFAVVGLKLPPPAGSRCGCSSPLLQALAPSRRWRWPAGLPVSGDSS
jgi:Kef-type K+ transport system membrane component KefB